MQVALQSAQRDFVIMHIDNMGQCVKGIFQDFQAWM